MKLREVVIIGVLDEPQFWAVRPQKINPGIMRKSGENSVQKIRSLTRMKKSKFTEEQIIFVCLERLPATHQSGYDYLKTGNDLPFEVRTNHKAIS